MDYCKDIIRELVPSHIEGRTIRAQSERTFDTEGEAEKLFDAAKNRLLDVNSWYRLDHKIGAAFALFNPNGAACAEG